MFYNLKAFKFRQWVVLSGFFMFLPFSGSVQASNFQENEDLYGTCEKRLMAVRGMFGYTPTEKARKQNYTYLEQIIASYVVRDYPAAKGNVYTFDSRFTLLSKVMGIGDTDIKRLAYKGFEMEVAPSLKSGYRLSRVSPVAKKIEQKDPILAALKNACVFDGKSTYMHKKGFTQKGSQQTFTFSTWLKRDKGGPQQYIFNIDRNGSFQHYLDFLLMGDELHYGLLDTSHRNCSKIMTQKFADFENWRHILFSVNSLKPQDQMRLYIDGERVAVKKHPGSINDFLPQYHDTYGWNNNAYLGVHGRYADSHPNIISGSMSQVYGIDGQALKPKHFGKEVNGKWVPIDYTGAYGTNGFHLDFSDANNLGKDTSGNNNHWTVSGPLKHVKL